MKKDSGYIVLDLHSGYMDGTYHARAEASAVCEDLAALYPTGEWLLLQRVGHCCGDGYPGIPGKSAWDNLQKLARFYGFADAVAAADAYDAREAAKT